MKLTKIMKRRGCERAEVAAGRRACIRQFRTERQGRLPLLGGVRWWLRRVAAAGSFAAILAAAPHTNAAAAPQSTEHVKLTMTYEFDYLRSLPDGYDVDRANHWPLLVFLHGAGERGRNPEILK